MLKTQWFNKRFSISCRVLLIVIGATLLGCASTSGPGGFSSASTQEMDPALRGRLDAAAEYLRKGNHRGARDHLQKAFKIDRSSPEAYDLLALLYYKELEYGLAEDNYRKAISLDRNFTRSFNNFGSFLYSRGRYSEALKILTEASKDVDYSLRAGVFYKLGLCNLRLDDAAKALESFQKVIALNPRGADAYLEMAALEYKAENLPKAKQYLNYYGSLAPKSTSRSLWLAARIDHLYENADGRDSHGLALSKLHPDSAETLAYKKWVKSGYTSFD